MSLELILMFWCFLILSGIGGMFAGYLIDVVPRMFRSWIRWRNNPNNWSV